MVEGSDHKGSTRSSWDESCARRSLDTGDGKPLWRWGIDVTTHDDVAQLGQFVDDVEHVLQQRRVDDDHPRSADPQLVRQEPAAVRRVEHDLHGAESCGGELDDDLVRAVLGQYGDDIALSDAKVLKSTCHRVGPCDQLGVREVFADDRQRNLVGGSLCLVKQHPGEGAALEQRRRLDHGCLLGTAVRSLRDRGVRGRLRRPRGRPPAHVRRRQPLRACPRAGTRPSPGRRHGR